MHISYQQVLIIKREKSIFTQLGIHQPVFPLYSVKHTDFDSNRKSICHWYIMPLRWITLLLFFLGNLNYAFSQATVTAAPGPRRPGSPAAPVAGQSVTVNVGCTLTVDQSTPPLNDLTINCVVIISICGQHHDHWWQYHGQCWWSVRE